MVIKIRAEDKYESESKPGIVNLKKKFSFTVRTKVPSKNLICHCRT